MIKQVIILISCALVIIDVVPNVSFATPPPPISGGDERYSRAMSVFVPFVGCWAGIRPASKYDYVKKQFPTYLHIFKVGEDYSNVVEVENIDHPDNAYTTSISVLSYSTETNRYFSIVSMPHKFGSLMKVNVNTSTSNENGMRVVYFRHPTYPGSGIEIKMRNGELTEQEISSAILNGRKFSRIKEIKFHKVDNRLCSFP